jgi:GR25 family glycosyltransferase involved in LPS biosynthesis
MQRPCLQAGLLLALAALLLCLLTASQLLQPNLLPELRSASALAPPPPPPPPLRAAAAGADAVAVRGVTPPGASGAGGIVWVPTDALADLNTSAFQPAGGCPPPPALCRLQDVFDEVIVLSLPRFPQRAQRAAAQLVALGTPFTMVQARDKRTGDVAGLAPQLMRDDHGSPGVFALYLTHLAMLRYVAQGPFRHFVFFEDDVTFAADFPAAFDAAARALPADWVAAWLGWIAQRRTDVPAPPPGALWATPIWHAQACALGLTREAAALLYDALLEFKHIIDQGPFRRLLGAFPGRAWAAYPPVAAANPYTDSTMGHGWPHSGADYRAANLVERARFDFWGRGYSGWGRAPGAAACVGVEAGHDYKGADVRGGGFPKWGDPAVDPPVPAATAAQCCAACLEDWPRCHYYTHVAADGACYRKYSSGGRAEVPQADTVSGCAASGWEDAQ